MLVMSLVVLGTFSFRGLGVDLFPKADPATVSVALTLPGASPDELSTSVIEPMEEAISGVSGIDEISARIAEGRGQITVRFVLERDINDASNDVREKVASAIRTMPPEMLPPVITKVDPDADPVMSLIVSSSAMSLRTLTELTDKQIARVIQTVNGVGEVSLSGGRAREIHVVVDIEKLNSYGLSMGEVREALIAENVEIPGGTIEQGKGQLLLRTLGRVDVSDDFNNIVVATKNGTPIRVSDIGRAEDTFERPTTAVWLGETPAVMVDVRRAMGENTVAVIEGVRARLATINKTLPSAVKVTVIRDDSRFIYASIASLEEHLIFGALFATLVVLFFIRNIRAVIISALAIPASIISSFTLMSIMGFTLNNMTLLAITLAVGIVIDDAIVVLENIFRYIEEKNCSPYEAAIEGTREVALAVMATTLSLVVIFVPIAFMDGYAKRFINPFGWTMAFAILVSMLVSFTLTPMLSSRFLKLADADSDKKTKEGGFFHWLDEWYTRRVNWALDHSTAIIVISVLTALAAIPLNRMVGREFVPNEDMGEWTVHADAPEGTSLAGTSELAFKLLKELQGIEGVADIEPSIGVSGMSASSSTHIHFLCQAKPIEERTNTQGQIITEMRKRLAAHPSVRPSITSRNALGSGEGSTGFPVAANILGPDLSQLVDYSKRALVAAQDVKSITEYKIALNVSNPEVHVAVDRKRAADLGVRMSTIGNTLRLAVLGRRSDLLLQGRSGAVPGQDARPRGAARRYRADWPADCSVGHGSGANRQHRAPRARPRPDDAAALGSAVHGHVHLGRRARACARRGVERRSQNARRVEHAADDVISPAGAVEDPRRNDDQPDHGDQPGDDLRLHGAGVAVRELPAAGRHHAGAADLGAVRALHAVGNWPHAQSVERARHAAPPRHRQEELDPAGGLRERPAGQGHAAARGDRGVVPHTSTSDSDDDDGNHCRPDPDVARHRYRWNRARRDRGDDHRRSEPVSPPDVVARSRGLREVRRARAGARRRRRQTLAAAGERGDIRASAPGEPDVDVGLSPGGYEVNGFNTKIRSLEDDTKKISSSAFLLRPFVVLLLARRLSAGVGWADEAGITNRTAITRGL